MFTLNNKQEELIIPSDAIRFRVIANSDSIEDQNTKLLVRDTIQTKMTSDLKETSNKEEAKTVLKNEIPSYENLVLNTLNKNNKENSFDINYGMNYFPEKVYKGVKYEEGYYESLVVTLGNGKGNNWWCVLFPPLCNLENKEYESEEYKLLVWEIIKRYTKN